MATPRKPNSRTTQTKKTTAKATDNTVNETVENVTENPTTPKKRAVKIDTVDHNALIPCRSAVDNLIYVSKRTKEVVQWASFGDTQYITYGELIAMKSNQARFFTQGWLIVDDEEVVEALGLKKIYGSLFEVDDIDEFFNLPLDEMTVILDRLPQGFKKSLAVFAREKIESGELDSGKTIKLLEEKLEVDLRIFG